MKGRSFLFLLFGSGNSEAPTGQKQEPYYAYVWADGEADERLLYAIAGERSACTARFSTPCATGNEDRRIDDILAPIASLVASPFQFACAKHALISKGAEALPAAARLLASPNEGKQLIAEEIIEHMGPTAASTLPALLQLLHADPPVQARSRQGVHKAIRALGGKVAAAIPSMVALGLADLHDDELRKTLQHLARFDPTATTAYYAASLNDATSRREAAQDLSELGPAMGVLLPDLVQQVRRDAIHADMQTMGALMHAIGDVGDIAQTVPILVAMLDEAGYADLAAETLARMGPRAGRAIPGLLTRLTHSDLPVATKLAMANALIAMGVQSRLVTDFLMDELIERNNVAAALPLSRVVSLPERYGAALQTASTIYLGQNTFICDALEHTEGDYFGVNCPVSDRRYDFRKLYSSTCTAPAQTDRSAPTIVNYCACRPTYPKAAWRNEETGTVHIALEIGADGKYIGGEIRKSSGFRDLDRATLSALSKCTFAAGRRDGKPVASSLIQTYRWDMWRGKTSLKVE